MKHRFIILAATLCAACTGTAVQDPASTVINPDGTVTFNYRNDNAREVLVSVQFAGTESMIRDSLTGLWSVTLGPAAPDMYPYSFIVDGVSVTDPRNPQYFPNEGFKNSILEIPGTGEPLAHTMQAVPHGNVDYVTYYSSAIGGYNNALVYTPASYNSSDRSYPVLYLISGTTDTEEVYYKVGRMNVIADNLAAQGKASEMIIVLPYGNPAKIMNKPGDGFGRGNLFASDLENDLMPYVEANYRTVNDAAHRAIGGFSRGGNQALSFGLTHLDDFSYLCSYSSFTSTALPGAYDNAEETNSRIRLFWLGIGMDDFLYRSSHDYIEFLDLKGINHTLEFTEGMFGHTWMNAKYFLVKTLPLLFNEEASAKAMADGGMPLQPLKGDEQPFTPSVMASVFPRQVTSPEFSEGAVTFRLKAERASEVRLEGEMVAEPVDMTRDEDGVWEVTLTNVIPDVYCYNFIVDGTRIADPTNMYLAPETGFKRSVLNMPGEPYAANNAVDSANPSGSVRYSKVTVQYAEDGTPSAVVVPDQWDGIRKVALLSGDGTTFQGWQQTAHASWILDQMTAAGKCRPCALYLIGGDKVRGDYDAVVNAADYPTWAEARRALAETLSELQ